ncbi:MAG: alpha/beta fold hydrolase [Pseudomonadota bacterium]
MAAPRVVRGFLQGSYGQLHVRSARPAVAARPALMCLHMSPKSSRGFADVMPFLASQRLVLAPDYPGMGESDPPPAEPHVTVEDYAREAWRVADQSGVGDLHVLGYHTGSMVAVEMATQQPARVRSVINISAPLFDATEAAQLDNTYSPIPLDEQGTRLTTMWSRVLAHRGPGMTLEMAMTSLAENLRGGEHYEWGHRAAFAYAPAYRERFAALTLPLLVINPKDDCWETSQRADTLMQYGERLDFPDWGHGFLSSAPQAAAEPILNFLKKHDRS